MAKVVYLANESSNQFLSDFDDFEYAQLRISTASAMRKFYHTPRRVIQYTKEKIYCPWHCDAFHLHRKPIHHSGK